MEKGYEMEARKGRMELNMRLLANKRYSYCDSDSDIEKDLKATGNGPFRRVSFIENQ